VIEDPRREHSRKPDEVYRRIEQLVAGPYCELFATQFWPGWSSWGDGLPSRAASGQRGGDFAHSEAICTIQDCGSPVHARGLCRAHYQRHRRHGDPLGGGARRRSWKHSVLIGEAQEWVA